MTPKKIPIFLLTGFLGSGKTSLLKAWLQSPELKDSALIINELGEVGIDQALLTNASEAASLVSNACVCCTGLQGLSQALEDLFWARLQRRVHRFPQLIIETTGLAMPGPILETLQESPLLLERYEWAGTITCVSATSFKEVMHEFKEAQAQLTQADLCILTKTDLIGSEELQTARLELSEFLAHHGLSTPVLNSSLSSLGASTLVESLTRRKASTERLQQMTPVESKEANKTTDHTQAFETHPGGEENLNSKHIHQHDGHHEHHEHHEHHDPHLNHQSGHHHLHAHAHFWLMPEISALSTRQTQVLNLKALMGTHLLRLKGWVVTPEGTYLIQMSPFDTEPQVEASEPLQAPGSAQNDRPWGLTVIVKDGLSKDKAKALRELIGL